MKKLLLAIIGLVVVMTAQAKPDVASQDFALVTPGEFIFFQFGAFYSSGYGTIINKYDEQDLLPASLGDESMTRFGFGYTFNNFLSVEVGLADNGVDFSNSRNTYIGSGTVQQKYNFDIYNFGSDVVLRSPLIGSSSDIHAKFGLVYTYGKETINYDTSGAFRPSWSSGQAHFNQIYTASGIAPLFDVGFGWSVSKYLAYQLDYQHVFKPVVGNAQYGDPLNSSMQATNMWLLGVLYHF